MGVVLVDCLDVILGGYDCLGGFGADSGVCEFWCGWFDARWLALSGVVVCGLDCILREFCQLCCVVVFWIDLWFKCFCGVLG